MYPLFASIALLFTANRPQAVSAGVAQRLMESAEARAGSNPQQAQELRCAASAYLSVVR